MEITRNYQASATKKVIDFLFLGNYNKPILSSFSVKIISKFSNQKMTEALALAAVILIWYEGFFSKYFPILGANWLVPILILTSFLFADKSKIHLNKPLVWYLAFLAIAAISSFIASVFGLSLKFFIPGWLIFVEFGITLFLSQSFNTIKFFKKIIFVSIPLLGISFYQFIIGVKTPQTWVSAGESDISTRVFAFFTSPNVLGGVLSLVIITSFFIFLKEKKKLYLIISFLSLAALLMTFSRSAWIGIFAAAVLTALIYRKKLVLFLPLSFLVLIFSKVRKRIFTVFSTNYLLDASLDGRTWSLINGWYIFKNNPFFGTGPGSYGGQIAVQNTSSVYLSSIQNGYTALYFTDNQWLEILVQTGIIGFLVFLGFLISVLALFIEHYKKSGDIMALAGFSSVVCFMVVGFFANVLEFGAISIPTAIIIGSLLND